MPATPLQSFAPCAPTTIRVRPLGSAVRSPCTTASVDGARLAVAAKLGTLDPTGKLVTAEYGTRVHVADVIRTDLPLTAA
jgi:epoxyqueuosine reductase QueG